MAGFQVSTYGRFWVSTEARMRALELHHPPIRIVRVRPHASDLAVPEPLLLSPAAVRVHARVDGFVSISCRREPARAFPSTAESPSAVVRRVGHVKPVWRVHRPTAPALGSTSPGER
jgi:hypothetical protein